MTSNRRLIAVGLAAVLLMSIVGPGVAMADTESATGNLSLDVSQTDGVLVTVTDDDAGVENATVNVTVADEHGTYDGAGAYTTDANGTVRLPTPESTVNVTVTATFENRTAETGVMLLAETENGDAVEEPFGQRVTAFLQALFGDSAGDDRTIGERVAGFVTSNNPGAAPDHAGPGAHDNSSDNSSDEGAPDVSDTSTDTRSGPPTHAGPNAGATPPGHVHSDDDVTSNGHQADSDATDSNSSSDDGNGTETPTSADTSGSTNAPGNSGNAPGNSGGSPGNSANAPENGISSPNNSGNTPGSSAPNR